MQSLNQDSLAKLKERADRVRERREIVLRAESEQRETLTKYESLNEEVATLKATLNVRDDKAVEKFQSKERHLVLVGETLEALPGKVDAAMRGLATQLRFVGPEMRDALLPGLNLLASKVADALEPFCDTRAEAEMIAKTTSAYRTYAGLITQLFGNASASVTEAEYALKLLDEIVSGKNPFKFKGFTLE